ncbi:hypothetical protein [Methanobrevibacter sp.]|uniref:hypothetical protein n=1 Tax=Methanobrevibacter sp. TaxID=66852 RepID=UPI003865D07E
MTEASKNKSIFKQKHDDFLIKTGKTKTYLRVNYEGNIVEKYVLKETDGSKEIVSKQTIFNIAPIEICESYNILNPDAKPKTSISFKRNGSPNIQTVTSDSIKQIIASLENRSGIVPRKQEANDALNMIVYGFQKLGKLKTVEEIPVAGVFINPKTGKLVRSDGEKEIKIVKPPKELVQIAFKVWQDLHEVYSGDKKKLSHILRYGLLLPFSYIFKTEYGWMPFLFLYGAAKTSKTTLAEISLSPYVLVDDDYSIGGGAFDSAYRIGHALEKQAYGLIVNEPGTMLQCNDCIEIIKRGTESAICREKWENNEHIKIPAYCNLIFTSNKHLPTQDSLVRRGCILEFTSDERATDEDVKKFNEKFNYTNKYNSRFNDLRPIGDYIIWYISQNLDLLSKDKKYICDELLDNLLDYADENKADWKWIYEEADLMDLQEADDDIKNIFIKTLSEDYKRLTPSEMYQEVKCEDDEKDNLLDNWIKILLKRLVIYAEFHETPNGEFIFINARIKDIVKERTGQTISCKSFASILGCKYTNYTYKKKTKKGFRIPTDKFIDLFY